MMKRDVATRRSGVGESHDLAGLTALPAEESIIKGRGEASQRVHHRPQPRPRRAGGIGIDPGADHHARREGHAAVARRHRRLDHAHQRLSRVIVVHVAVRSLGH